MFKNKVTILVTVGVLIAIAIGLKFIKNQEKTLPKAIGAVPEDAALLIETEKFVSLLQSFNTNNQFKREFSDVIEWEKAFKNLEFLDSLISSNSDFKDIIEGNRLIISGHISANNQLEFLYVMPAKSDKHEELVNKVVASVSKENATKRQRLYENFTIYDVLFFEEGSEVGGFSYTFANDLLIFSLSKILVEESVRRLNSGFSLAMDKGFSALNESAGKNVDANIYINYRNFPKSLKNILENNKTNAQFYDFMSGFAAWSELDLKLKDDAFLLSGFTFSDDSLTHYLNIFKNQSPVDHEFLSTLPGNTSAFLAFNLSDCKAWKTNYAHYLQKLGDYSKLDYWFENASVKYKKDLQDAFYNNIEGGLAMSWMNKNLASGEQDIIGLIQLKDAAVMKKHLLEIKPVDSLDKLNYRAPRILDQKTGLKAYFFPEPEILSQLFGKAFKQVKANYWLIKNETLVFGHSTESLKLYLRKSKAGSSLLDDKDFARFSQSLSSESNIFLYTNVASSKRIFAEQVNPAHHKILKENDAKFNKIQAAAIQFGTANNLLFTNVYLNYNPQFRKKNKNIWEVKLESSFAMKPKIVKNHNTNNNEIILQDSGNKLVLISTKGQVLWKIQISGKIMGEIHQVDVYKNNKLQYMFNTKEQLYLVDRNGKNVDGFPIKFKSPATNGIAVFDYENKRDYRILVACANKNIYLLNGSGGKIDGWEFGQTQSEVSLPAQLFTYNSKDYIVFADKKNTYIVNRKGQTRIKPSSAFEKSTNTPFFIEKGSTEEKSWFVSTGSNGNVYFIYFNGLVKKMSLGKFSKYHQFAYADIDGSGKNYFIITDKNKLFVFNRNKSVRFEQKFDGMLKNSLNLYKMGKKTKYIGVSPEGTNKVYLIHPSGKVVKGFPMHGNGAFSITKLNLSEKTGDLNLIVGNAEDYLFNYRLITK